MMSDVTHARCRNVQRTHTPNTHTRKSSIFESGRKIKKTKKKTRQETKRSSGCTRGVSRVWKAEVHTSLGCFEGSRGVFMQQRVKD